MYSDILEVTYRLLYIGVIALGIFIVGIIIGTFVNKKG